MKVLVTGSKGFVGKNLCSVIRRREDLVVYEYDLNNASDDLDSALSQVDCIFHLAGVNRPKDKAEFETGNAGSIEDICQKLTADGSQAQNRAFIFYTG